MEQPKSAEAFRKNLQKTSLFDIFVGGDVPNITTDTATEDEIIIPGIRRGNRLYVDVEINDEQTVTLVVDTGATDIALASKIANKLGLSKWESREATYNTA